MSVFMQQDITRLQSIRQVIAGPYPGLAPSVG